MASSIKLQRKRQHPGRPVGGRAPKSSPEGNVAGRVRRQDEGCRTFEVALEKTQPTAICWSGHPVIRYNFLSAGNIGSNQNCQKGVQLRALFARICIVEEQEYLFECPTSARKEATVTWKKAQLWSR